MPNTISSTLTASYMLQAQYTTVLSTGGVSINSGTAIYSVLGGFGVCLTLVNAGYIGSKNGVGVALQDFRHDHLTNQAGGVIYGSTRSVQMGHDDATVLNKGVIGNLSNNTGVFLGGFFDTVTNTGVGAVIAGSTFGVFLSIGGTVNNDTGSTIASNDYGMLGGSATLTNDGLRAIG